jgi:hypothetical protein
MGRTDDFSGPGGASGPQLSITSPERIIVAKKSETEATSTKVRWDDSDMSTSYANVCNVSSTREEVTLLFGTNQSWHTGQEEVVIKLSDRLIVSPYAAKRLSLLLQNIVEQYEQRFGALSTDVTDTGPAS